MNILSTLVQTAVVLGFSSASATILPPNNLHLQDRISRAEAMTEQEFNDIIDNIIKKFEPIVAKHGATLVVNKFWEDPTVNAYAQQIGTTWSVAMFGGLARRPEVTPDGFALVVCHELGHHLAGATFKGEYWPSSEGQADYFATQSCAHEIWKDQDNSFAAETVDAVAKAGCDSAWKNSADRNICYRSSMAAQSLANLLGYGQSSPKFNSPDLNIVFLSDPNHPQAQCRLDTYYQGALCNKEFDLSIIPGKEHVDGQLSAAAEEIANKYSCNIVDKDFVGVRPACWFRSVMSFPK